MSSRSHRMIVMAQQRQTVEKRELELADKTQFASIPSYESTKGSTFFEKEFAVRGWQQLEMEARTQMLKEALEKEIIFLKQNDTKVTVTENRKEDEAGNDMEEIDNKSDLDSEDRTSGSEYIPSNNGSPECSSNSSDLSTDACDSDSQIININETKHRQLGNKNDRKLFASNLKQHKNDDNMNQLPTTSKVEPDTTDMIDMNNIDKEKENIDRSNPKIKILSNIQLMPTTSNHPISVINADLVTAAADSTTETRSNNQNSTNLVKISAAKKTDGGKRIRNKKHSCYYCRQMVLHIARHLEIKHENERDVARALAFPKNSKKRKELFSEITRAGDFHYNCEVMSLKQGELILVRRPTESEIHFNKYKDYGPCPKCLGFLLKRHLWHHLKTQCSEKDLNEYSEEDKQSNRQVIAESNAIISNVFGTEFSSNYKIHIVNTLRDDEVGNCCREDNLILKFGAMLFEKYGTTQCELIRQNMRQLARLTLTIRDMTTQNLKLFDLLAPQKFDLVVQGVKELCHKYQDDSTKRPEFMTPSLALKLGHSLKKCANIERGLALREENLRRNESLLAFCNLMELEWQIRISSNALSTLHKRKLNAGQLLPVTNDLLKLNNYIKKEIELAQIKLINSPDAETWTRLGKLLLCRIILFNKRRAGEASKMTLEQYATRPMWSEETNAELKNALTAYEVKLAERNVVVNIIGKRGRIVPVLLTPEIKVGIDILISHRNEALGINPKNPYIFARGLQALTHMRGPDVLRNIVGQVEELEKPILITSTKLRKYIATVCQVFDLSENEYDWLARHLGHDIRVHREFYRLHEDVVELTKVSRLLMAVDTGEANKFSGKQLKDIQLTDLPPVEEELDNVEDEEDELKEAPKNKNSSIALESDSGSKDDSHNKEDSIQTKQVKEMKSNKKCPWNVEEKRSVFENFRVQIKKGIVPGKADCEACQDKYPDLKKRKWTDIKFCVKNQIAKMKKMKQA